MFAFGGSASLEKSRKCLEISNRRPALFMLRCDRRNSGHADLFSKQEIRVSSGQDVDSV
jgi:hypothetical protein